MPQKPDTKHHNDGQASPDAPKAPETTQPTRPTEPPQPSYPQQPPVVYSQPPQPTYPQQPPTQPPQQAPYPQPGYAQYPQPMAGVPNQNPGETLGIVGLVLNFLGISIGGIICGAMSRSRSKAVGAPTALGTVSLVWGIVTTALVLVTVVIIGIILLIAAANTNY